MFFAMEWSSVEGSAVQTKKLISTTLLYGIGDLLVMAISGFFLIPLYTRTLTQEEYGIYSILRANTDIFTYALHFGLISAVSRLYFDYKRIGENFEYLSSIIILFLIIVSLFCVMLFLFGNQLWSFLSPQVPSYPYILFCLSISIFCFFSGLLLLWLRVENNVSVFVFLQILMSFSVLSLVFYALVVREGGLADLLWAMVVNAMLSALLLPIFLWKKFKFTVKWDHVSKTLRFAVPIAFGYFAYFLINRGSLLVLQRYVAVEQVAIFGLCQQIAMIVVLASNAFAKTLQPIIYSAETEKFSETVERTGKLYFLMMACLVSLIVLFSSEILAIAAPKNYDKGYVVFILLVLSNFVYSLNFISNSVLLYYKFSLKSVLITVLGGIFVLAFNVFLIPKYELYGASISMVIVSFFVLFAGFYLTKNLIGMLNLKYVFLAIPMALTVTAVTCLLRYLSVKLLWVVCIKITLATTLIYFLYRLLQQKSRITA